MALNNLATVADAAGTSMAKVVSCTVFMVNITGDFEAMNGAYEGFFPKDPPSRTAVQVASLAGGAVVEIQCIAAAQTATTSVVPLPPSMKFPLSPQHVYVAFHQLQAFGKTGCSVHGRVLGGGLALML